MYPRKTPLILASEANNATDFKCAAADYLFEEYIEKIASKKDMPEIYGILSERLTRRKRNIICTTALKLTHMAFDEADSDMEQFIKVIDTLQFACTELKLARQSINNKAFLFNPFGPGISEKLIKNLLYLATKQKEYLEKNTLDDITTQQGVELKTLKR